MDNLEPQSKQPLSTEPSSLCENSGIDSASGSTHVMQPNSAEPRSLSDRVQETPSQTQRCTTRLQNRGALATGSGNAITNSRVYHSLGSRFCSAAHATWTRSSIVAWFIFHCSVTFLHPVATALGSVIEFSHFLYMAFPNFFPAATPRHP